MGDESGPSCIFGGGAGSLTPGSDGCYSLQLPGAELFFPKQAASVLKQPDIGRPQMIWACRSLPGPGAMSRGREPAAGEWVSHGYGQGPHHQCSEDQLAEARSGVLWSVKPSFGLKHAGNYGYDGLLVTCGEGRVGRQLRPVSSLRCGQGGGVVSAGPELC